ncbi:phosphotriesterase family protein [Streptomyces albipurpureus]|uniref:Phosphotriesterase n=1 Tax=Streptomyces albipurpureus TaxID=2897419 RepID=A0ABT0UYT9_9ACTN|nr:hypothetical protein [Streptomyces sp. CWNU-1]MCM2393602.1 hypothetical protein [Streptomyces sp. CWNU-1]
MTRDVMTVRGPVAAEELGSTLMHEHLLVNTMREHRAAGLLNDGIQALAELVRFRSEGGRTVVDLTNRSLGQRPADLRRLSEESGVNIVLGTGFYRQAYFDRDWMDRTSTRSIAELFVRDLTVGIDDTEVRAGIIGEIGCEQYISAQEERVFRAAAIAHRETGATISTHAAHWPVGLEQLDLLESAGVDPQRVIIGHCDSVGSPDWTRLQDVTDYHRAIARRGAYVEFDHIRKGVDLDRRIEYVLAMAEAGLIDHVLLSHDLAFRPDLSSHGGAGLTVIATTIVPQLRARGLSAKEIDRLLIDNPRRALTGTD